MDETVWRSLFRCGQTQITHNNPQMFLQPTCLTFPALWWSSSATEKKMLQSIWFYWLSFPAGVNLCFLYKRKNVDRCGVGFAAACFIDACWCHGCSAWCTGGLIPQCWNSLGQRPHCWERMLELNTTPLRYTGSPYFLIPLLNFIYLRMYSHRVEKVWLFNN